MILNAIGLIIDFGLVVLIWMVQLVVYPSFLYFEKGGLLSWHSRYTPAITQIVAPLMFAQLIIASVRIFDSLSYYTITYAALVVLIWIVTFVVFIPLHEKIQLGVFTNQTLTKLVKYNWFRTLIWTLLFIVSVIQLMY